MKIIAQFRLNLATKNQPTSHEGESWETILIPA
jgi:hypothetical protein